MTGRGPSNRLDSADDEGGDSPEEDSVSSTLERALGRAWFDDVPWDVLTTLTEIPHRMGGSAGEREAAEVLFDAFQDAGCTDVTVQEFPVLRWTRGSTELTVTEPTERSFEAIALPYSPAATVSGRLVDVGYGTPAEIDAAGDDVSGSIVIASTTTPPGTRFVHRMEKVGHAVDAGAAAFVFVNHVSGQLPPTGSLAFNEDASLPGVGVSAETGDWLTEYADRGSRARLDIDAITTSGTSQNVVGSIGRHSFKSADDRTVNVDSPTDTSAAPAIDGSIDASEEILLLAHYDSHDVTEGALDNGCGIATVIGATRLLSDIEEELDCPIRVVAVGCEEVGLVGASALADSLDSESIKAVVNVDGAGRFSNLRAFSHTATELEVIADHITDLFGQPVRHESDPHPFSDHWPFLQMGIPSLQLHSEPPDDHYVPGGRGRGWAHTAADTRDKADARIIRNHAMLTALIVRELSRSSLSRVDVTELRDTFVERDYVDGMCAAGVWPDSWETNTE